MYYRYEARRVYGNGECGEWKGIFQALTPGHRRKAARFLKEPAWYGTHDPEGAECWLTEYGFQKYHDRMQALIDDCGEYYYPVEARVLKRDALGGIVMHGKVQAIIKRQ